MEKALLSHTTYTSSRKRGKKRNQNKGDCFNKFTTSTKLNSEYFGEESIIYEKINNNFELLNIIQNTSVYSIFGYGKTFSTQLSGAGSSS